MSDFVKGLLSAAGGALVFGVFLAIAYFGRNRYPRTRDLEDIDYDNARPDGWMGHFKAEDKQ
ncbi:hypothetical protein [Rhizobium sp. BK456]|uniref:hypothetical protein n=1 Tax=Rhizobium sp. BK456 TaxID=2587007 RepID=UPI0016149680|nr:hypothetical protein [Rhizobium sp. BK456]MBB3521081.1 hypothetical protein [Rhizobium sp. BK456]